MPTASLPTIDRDAAIARIKAASPKVKPARRTIRVGDRFGAGILRFVPYPVTYPDHFEPSEADRAWAAQHLNADSPDWDALAAESEAIDRMERGIVLA